MPGCCAYGCSNRYEDGFKLYGFPSSKKPTEVSRRKRWLSNLKRDKWQPTDFSRLCEVHFETDQFELGPSGRKRLKGDAVPTIFSFKKPLRNKRKAPKYRQPLEIVTSGKDWDHNYSATTFKLILHKVPPPRSSLHQQEDKENFPTLNHVVPSVDSLQNNVDIPAHESSCPHELCDPLPDESILDLDIDMNDSIVPTPVVAKDILVETCKNSCARELKTHKRHLAQYKRHMNDFKNKLKFANREMQELRNSLKRSQKKEEQQRKNLKFLRSKLWKYVKPKELQNATLDTPTKRPKKVVLEKNKKYARRWTSEELKKGLRLRFACGTNGYETLLKEGMELPTIRTLNKHTEKFEFESGVLHEVFELLRIKTNSMKSDEKKCVMTLDEMSLKSGRRYDVKSDRFIGDVTLPKHKGLATKSLVFMIAGNTTKWKQPVAYYFTPSSVDGTVFIDIVLDILRQADRVNLNVTCIISDMGASNLAL